MNTIDAAGLAAAVTANTNVALTADVARRFLAHWERQGLTEQPQPGRWRLTPAGRQLADALTDYDNHDLEDAA